MKSSGQIYRLQPHGSRYTILPNDPNPIFGHLASQRLTELLQRHFTLPVIRQTCCGISPYPAISPLRRRALTHYTRYPPPKPLKTHNPAPGPKHASVNTGIHQ
jgi:hypothetical protein